MRLLLASAVVCLGLSVAPSAQAASYTRCPRSARLQEPGGEGYFGDFEVHGTSCRRAIAVMQGEVRYTNAVGPGRESLIQGWRIDNVEHRDEVWTASKRGARFRCRFVELNNPAL